MKLYRLLLYSLVALALLFISSQALASPVESAQVDILLKETKTPKPKGSDKATQKSEDKATKQAEKDDDKDKDDKQKGKHVHFKGTVSAVDTSSLTLTLKDGSSVTVGLTADTRIKFAGKKNLGATIEVGMMASVQAFREENDTLIARSVMVIPGKPEKVHRVGVVTEYTPGVSITIQDKDGNTYTFQLTDETKILPAERAADLEVGSRVTIIAPRDPATGGVIVKGIVVHPAK